MNTWRTIASICEILPDNHPILIERKEEGKQVNLFTDFLCIIDEEKEKVLDEILKELEGDGVVGRSPRVRASEHGPYLIHPEEETFTIHMRNFYRNLNDQETQAKIKVILFFIAWTIGWLGVIPYAMWRLTEQGWPFIGG